ncbi:MAG TPA: tetratricopeptide repeat protein, partial [Armatimonadaceae bacterium]|nr:tetratricopeptide repeat protein [Armatimonadaceae bacterium]
PEAVPPPPPGEYRAEDDPLWSYASVRLFADRARQARFDFALSPENRETVAALCTRLEGIPLAIELCAAWAATLSPEQMLADLNSRFDLLVSRRRDLPERHRTLRAAVESSFLQLPPELRATFALLSVFRGGWTGEAAEAIQPPQGGGGHAAARDRLAQLYERSLILAEETPHAAGAGRGGALRYRMLDTLREFAGDQLTDAERRRAAARHAAYYLALAEEAAAHLSGPDQRRYFDLLEGEHENLRAALGRLRAQAANPAVGALERREAARSGLRLATALARFWQVRGHSAEGRDWLEGFLSADAPPRSGPEGDDAEREARGRGEAGRLAWAQSDYAAAQRHQEAALRLWRGVGDAAGVAEALLDLGMIAFRQGRLGDARPLLEESLRTARDAGDTLTTAGALLNLGNIASEEDDYARARGLYEESLGIARAAGERRRVAAALNNLGNVARRLGDFAAATRYQEETLALRRELGDRSGCATSLLNLAEIARQQGLWGRAEDLLAESLQAQRELGDPFAVSECLLVFAGVAGGAGDFARSAALLGAARAVRAAIASDLSPSDRERWAGFAEAARAALGSAGFASACARGERLSLDEAVAFALEQRRGEEK